MTGGTKVKAAIEGGDAIALLTATDAAEDGRKKMAGVAPGVQSRRRGGFDGASVPHFELLEFEPNWVWHSGLKM